MTHSFWAALAVLTVLALAFIFYPFFFSSRAQRQQMDRRSQNLANYRHRLAELEADREAGVLDEATFVTLKEELDAALLEDLGETAEKVPVNRSRERRAVLAVVLSALVALPILAFGLYERWGASAALVQAEAMRALDGEVPVSPEQLEEMLVQLRNHLEQEPENVDGWALLGRTNMQLQRYPEAAYAYEGLAQQLDGEPTAATAWGLVAQALYLESERQWNEAIAGAIDKARAIDKDEVNSLGLLGIAAYEQQDFRQAANHWTRILEVAPDYPQYASIANGVASAYRALDEPVPAQVRQLLNQSPSPQTASASAGPGEPEREPAEAEPAETEASVTVEVEISPDLPVPDGDASLFIYARAVDGPPMPLAVARLQARDLPVTVTLDDSAAMTPQARLSSAERVVLGARISTSGDATAASGDLEGLSESRTVSRDMGKVRVMIDRQRP